ncbi:siroheme synthase, N-terminal domain protein [Slackia heliotrinireducens DSM 20476]|uniref:precorrin-2 dehydrogenase n=2 Tax=Slackia TaxID=84108 RepID=C7N5K8_SLAHD|nr:siroheme synthase, N-terminal domain protein [Slackia heliotrinireducens DSM 20476]
MRLAKEKRTMTKPSLNISQKEATQDFAPYPLFIYLEELDVVVIGAGRVAERKIETLLDCGATVTAIAPKATQTVLKLAEEGRISYIQRCYKHGDLEGAILAVVATDNTPVNEAAYAEAVERHMLVNVVDVPHLCNCIVPSIMRRGKLQVAVSTAGAAPTVAKKIRRRLEEQYPAYWEDYVDLLGDVRNLVKAHVPGPASIRTPLYEAVSAAGLEDRIKNGETISAVEVFETIVMPLAKDLGIEVAA